MDVLCDTVMVEEILPRLRPKCLVRLGAVSRRYNALARRPDFAARYWRRAGVIFQPFDQPEVPPFFLTAGAGGHAATATDQVVHGADLSFLPGPSAHEAAYLRHAGSDPEVGFAVLASAGGLLLCSRGRLRAVHLYVCNPVTCQWVALPELPLPLCKRHCGHLAAVPTGGTDLRFKVVVANNANHWRRPGGGQLDLRVFDSGTGRWEARRSSATAVSGDVAFDNIDLCSRAPMVGQSGTSYWTSYGIDMAVAYDSAGDSLRVIALPDRLADSRWERYRCIGERHHGGLRYMESNRSVLQVWDDDDAQQGGGGGVVSSWRLVHRVGTAELMERNPEAAVFLRNKKPSTWDEHGFKPVGVHPTQDDVVFLALPGAVVAYSIQHGTISLECAYDERYLTAADMFPYVHPPFPLQIPSIKTTSVLMTLTENRGGPAASLVSKTADRGKKRKIDFFR